jgi:hypothetical protein
MRPWRLVRHFFYRLWNEGVRLWKKREILGISKKCYFFIHFPIFQLSRSDVHPKGGKTPYLT